MARIKKYTLEIFQQRGQEIHNNKYDYSLITNEHINNGARSLVTIKCNDCGTLREMRINDHINHKLGCQKCSKKPPPLTWEDFFKRTEKIHGDKYDYSQINKEIPCTTRNTIIVICNHCGKDWKTTISTHIYSKHGCPYCAGNIPYDLARFRMRAEEVHGDKYDYSEVRQDHIKNAYSHVPIICNTCEYEWAPTINNHINNKTGCPDCSGNVKWTLIRVLRKCYMIHGIKFDYSQIGEEHIQGWNSHIPLKCNICRYKWSPTINDHINSKSGCPDCAGQVPWDLQRFTCRARQLHGAKYDYSQIAEYHFNGKDSKVLIKCNDCGTSWKVSIQSHINCRSGCPECAGVIPWELNSFIERGRQIHDDKYDYSQIGSQDVINCKSRILIICKCGCKWKPRIKDHINKKSGCPKCAGHIAWVPSAFIVRAKQIHGEKYDYSNLNEGHFNGNRSHVPIRCISCNEVWTPTIDSHIHGKRGCPNCCFKNGFSQAAISWLQSMEKHYGIDIQYATKGGEFRIQAPSGRYYKVDGYHKSTNTIFEYYGSYWHGHSKLYDANAFNKSAGKTFGELFQNTIDRENYLMLLGYNLIVQWETPLYYFHGSERIFV